MGGNKAATQAQNDTPPPVETPKPKKGRGGFFGAPTDSPYTLNQSTSSRASFLGQT